ncbi:MAG: ABC transporter substrate-binding protein [Syntrophorhabdales bacterium]|jgi:branched-chain amino acid transport system substrate-binding protein
MKRLSLCVAGLALLLALLGQAWAAEPIRVGIVDTYTGPVTVFTNDVLDGFRLAVNEINAGGGVLGRRIEYITRDDGSRPLLAVAHARELIRRERVDVLVGTSNGGAARAVSELCRTERVPLLVTFSHVQLAGERLHRYLFRIDGTPSMAGQAAAAGLSQKPFVNYWIAGDDQAYGHALATGLWTELKRLRPDVRVIGQTWWKGGEGDYPATIEEINRARPDCAIIATGPTQVVRFQRAAASLGLTVPFYQHWGTEPSAAIRQGRRAPVGVLGTSDYLFYYPDTPANRTFADSFKAAYNRNPRVGAFLGYVSARLVAEGYRRAGQHDRERFVDALEGASVETPVGRVEMREHQARAPMFFGVTKRDPRFPEFPVASNIITVVPSDYGPGLPPAAGNPSYPAEAVRGRPAAPALVPFGAREPVCPSLQVARVETVDAEGRRAITKGKEITVTLSVRNAGGAPARQVSAAIESANWDVAVLGENRVVIGPLNPGEMRTCSFSFDVTRRYAGPAVLPLSFRIDEERTHCSVRPAIRLALDEEEPGMRVARLGPRADAQGRTGGGAANIVTPPALRNEQKVFGENDAAVVIGIEQYRGNVPQSRYSRDDARAVQAYLEALGFARRNIQYLRDQQATLSDIRKSIEAWLPNRVRKGSKVFIYYSGHGAPEPSTGSAYLVPYDGDAQYLKETGYSLTSLYERLDKLEASEVMVVLDACFSGSGSRSILANGVRPLVVTAPHAGPPPNTVVLSAARENQISASSNDMEHGILTYYFLKAIKQGKKSMRDIYEYVKPQVEDEAKRMNIDQTPAIDPDPEKLKGRFVLAR